MPMWGGEYRKHQYSFRVMIVVSENNGYELQFVSVSLYAGCLSDCLDIFHSLSIMIDNSIKILGSKLNTIKTRYLKCIMWVSGINTQIRSKSNIGYLPYALLLFNFYTFFI